MAKGGASGGLKTAPKSTGGANPDNAMSTLDYVGYRAVQMMAERRGLSGDPSVTSLIGGATPPAVAREYDFTLGGSKKLTEANSAIASSPNNRLTRPYDNRSRRALGYGAGGA